MFQNRYPIRQSTFCDPWNVTIMCAEFDLGGIRLLPPRGILHVIPLTFQLQYSVPLIGENFWKSQDSVLTSPLEKIDSRALI